MKSRTLTCITTMTLLPALLMPISVAAQEEQNESATTGTTNPVPLINQPLMPDAIKPGVTGLTLTLNGTGFVPGSVVRWNGSSRATTFVNGSRLTASILMSDIA